MNKEFEKAVISELEKLNASLAAIEKTISETHVLVLSKVKE